MPSSQPPCTPGPDTPGTAPEHRRERRYARRAPVEVRAPDPRPGELRDLGGGGLCVAHSCALAPGMDVDVVVCGNLFLLHGTVRHSTPVPGGGYRIGIAFRRDERAVVAALLEVGLPGGG